MGYCGRQWISGYHFSVALDHRLQTEAECGARPGIRGRDGCSRSAFDMPETAHLDGASSFGFAIPAPGGWAGAIEHITLEGPDGTAVLDPETRAPAIIVRDPADGRVLGLLTDPPPALLSSLDGRASSPLSGFDIAVIRRPTRRCCTRDGEGSVAFRGIEGGGAHPRQSRAARPLRNPEPMRNVLSGEEFLGFPPHSVQESQR